MIALLNCVLIRLPRWHCVTFYCAFSNIHLFCKLTPDCILQLCDLLKNKNTICKFLVSHLCCLFIILNMSRCQTPCFFHKFCSIPSQCLHNMSFSQIACFFPGTHKLFHEPLLDLLTPLLSTPPVFPRMVTFSFHESIFDILSALSLATFVVSDVMNHLPVLHSFHFLSS